MGLCNIPDIFQECMYKIFSDLEYVCVYIDDLFSDVMFNIQLELVIS
jgi:hypothetical protein